MANIDVNGTGNANLIFGRGAGNANLSFGGSGSGGGTSDYTLLRNKPSINGVTLIGNKTSSDLYIHDLVTVDYNSSSFSLIDAAVDRQQDVVCIYRPTIDELYYLPLTHYDTPTHTYTFSGIYDGKMVSTSVNQSGTWTNKTETVKDTVFVNYNITSYAAVEAAVYANKNVVCIKGADSGEYFCDLLEVAKDENDINIYIFSYYNLANSSLCICVLTENGWTFGTYPILTPNSDEALPPGGNTGQVLTKVSNTSYDVEWASSSGGTVFYAEYGDTTYASVAAAIAADMYVVCVFSFLSGPYSGGPFYAPLLYNNDQHDTFHFYTMFGKTGYGFTLDSTDGWSQIGQDSFEQVQSDWSVTDADSPAYIGNKPTIPSKTSDLTNDSGFLTVSTVPHDVFYASYNITTYSSVLDAFESGKTIICNNSNHYYPLLEYSPSAGKFIFSGINNTTRVQIGLRQSGGWQTPDEESLTDIFWATYNTTTSAQITAALSAGKMVFVELNGEVYAFSYMPFVGSYKFSRFNNGTESVLWCSNDVWSTSTTGYIEFSSRGAANGVCPLDSSGKVAATYLPVYSGGVS